MRRVCRSAGALVLLVWLPAACAIADPMPSKVCSEWSSASERVISPPEVKEVAPERANVFIHLNSSATAPVRTRVNLGRLTCTRRRTSRVPA